MTLKHRFLSKGNLNSLLQLMQSIGIEKYFDGEVELEGSDPILGSPHFLGDAVSSVLCLDAVAAASIWKYRTDIKNNIKINIFDAIHFLHPTHFIWQSGYPIHLGAEFVPTNGLYKCKDGRVVMIESGPPYQKLERGYLNFFNCGNNREAIAKAIAKWNSLELEETLSNHGLPCCTAFSREEWLQHPQGKILGQTPVIEIEKIADGKPCEFSDAALAPLSGIKILDFTHVLAGPRSTRTLAEFGADVLHISSPYHRDTLAQNFAVNYGKKSAYLDISQKQDMNQLQTLLSDADVFAFSYRPSIAEKFSLNPLQVIKHSKKGIICLSINAYGHEGPWKDRAGFDQNGQVASGFAVKEGTLENPQFSPVFYLTDLLTAYFAAAGMMAALLRRAIEGGSYHVKVSLTRSAMWVQELGFLDEAAYKSLSRQDNYPTKLVSELTPYGKLTHLAPVIQFSNMPPIKIRPVVPYGADSPSWEI